MISIQTNEVSKNFPYQDITGVVSKNKLEYILGIKIIELKKIIKNIDIYYNPFEKKVKNKNRLIDNPRGRLKYLQSKIKDRILAKIPLPENMYGGLKGKSIKNNASIHKNQKVVVKLDLKNCFPNISHKMVYSIFRYKLEYSTKLASLLTKLTTYKGHLPQGSPASTVLANIILTPLSLNLTKYANTNNLKLSFWVDDIVFSGEDTDKHITNIVRIIHKHMFSVSNYKDKLKVMRRNYAQIVTGVCVNRKIGIPKGKRLQYEREIKQLNKNYSKANYSSIHGKLEHVKFINQAQFNRLQKLFYKI